LKAKLAQLREMLEENVLNKSWKKVVGWEVTEWSDPSGKLTRYFGKPLGRGSKTAPRRWGGEMLVQKKR